MTDQTDEAQPIRKGLLPCIPPPEWEFSTVYGARTGTDGCALFPGDTGPVVVRRRVSYGDWEPVRPDRWAPEPPPDGLSAAVDGPQAPDGQPEKADGANGPQTGTGGLLQAHVALAAQAARDQAAIARVRKAAQQWRLAVHEGDFGPAWDSAATVVLALLDHPDVTWVELGFDHPATTGHAVTSPPGHDSGPTIREAAADDAAHWNTKYAGEGS